MPSKRTICIYHSQFSRSRVSFRDIEEIVHSFLRRNDVGDATVGVMFIGKMLRHRSKANIESYGWRAKECCCRRRRRCCCWCCCCCCRTAILFFAFVGLSPSLSLSQSHQKIRYKMFAGLASNSTLKPAARSRS